MAGNDDVESLQNPCEDESQRQRGDSWRDFRAIAFVFSLAAVLVSIFAIFRVDSLIHAGPEGGWLACLYAKILFGMAAAVNCIVLAATTLYKTHRQGLLVAQLLAAMIPVLLLWWVLGYDSRRAAIPSGREFSVCSTPFSKSAPVHDAD